MVQAVAKPGPAYVDRKPPRELGRLLRVPVPGRGAEGIDVDGAQGRGVVEEPGTFDDTNAHRAAPTTEAAGRSAAYPRGAHGAIDTSSGTGAHE